MSNVDSSKLFAGGWDGAAPGPRSVTPPPAAARPSQRIQQRWEQGSFISADGEQSIISVV